MTTLTLELAQLFVLGRQHFGGGRSDGLAEASEQLSIDGIGFGEPTAGSRVLADSAGLDQAEVDPSPRQSQEQATLIAATGFTNHLDGSAAGLRQALQQLPVTAS